MSSSKLREALRDKIGETRGCIGHPDYASEIEQNAAQTVLRVLEELNQVVEYREAVPEHYGFVFVVTNGDPITFSEELRGTFSASPGARRHQEEQSGRLTDGLLIERLKCEEAEKYENEQRYESREGWTKIDKKYGKRKTNRAQALGGGKKAGRLGVKIPARPRGRIAR